MKQRIVLLLLTGLLAFTQATAQLSPPDKRVAIKINPLSIFVLTGNGAVEVFLNNRMSVQVAGYYGRLRTGFGASEFNSRIEWRHLGLTPEFRYYMGVGEVAAPSGLYASVFGRFRNYRLIFDADIYDPDFLGDINGTIRANVNNYSGGVLLGYQLVTEGGFVFDAYIGPQFGYGKVDFDIACPTCDGDEIFDAISELPKFGTGSAGVRWGIGLGYAF